MKISKYLVLILVLSLLPLLILFSSPLLPHTHDGPVHLARMAAWIKAFDGGQIPPRWAGGLNYGFGSPVMIFMYPWPYLLSGLFLKLGLSLVASFKLILSLSFLFSGLFMFLFGKELFEDEKKAFLTALLYQFAAFRFVEIMVRGALGEVWTYSFIPLVFWGILKIIKKDYLSGFLLASLGAGLLILAHNSISLSFFGLAVLFIIIFGRNFGDRILSFLSLGLGLGLSSFYWLVALWERKYTYGDLFMKDLFRDHFPSLKQLFWPNFANSLAGQVKDIPMQIGFFPLLVLILTLILFLRRKLSSSEKKILYFVAIVFLLVLFLMQSVSTPLWERFSLLRQFQFSWRLLALFNFTLALLGFSFLKIFKEKVVLLPLSFLIVVSSYFYWLPPKGFKQIDEMTLWNYPYSTTYFGEADTIWAAHPPDNYPKERVVIIGGQGEIVDLATTLDSQAFQVKAENEVGVLSNTLYFPGWRLFVDGEEKQVQFQDQNYRGLITFPLETGEHRVKLEFTRTKDRILAEMISFVSLSFWLGILTIKSRLGKQ